MKIINLKRLVTCITFVGLVLMSISIQAQRETKKPKTVKVPLELKEVDLYQNGALLNFSNKILLKSNLMNVKFENIPFDFDMEQLRFLPNVKYDILKTSFYLKENTSSGVEKLNQKILKLENTNETYANIIRKSDNNNYVFPNSVQELQLLVDYISKIRQEIENNKKTIKVLKHKKNNLLQDQETDDMKYAVLELEISTENIKDSAEFVLFYIDKKSNWQNELLMNINTSLNLATIAQYAKINQKSGLPWENIKLSLYDSKINNGNVISKIEPWKIDFVKEKRNNAPQPMMAKVSAHEKKGNSEFEKSKKVNVYDSQNISISQNVFEERLMLKQYRVPINLEYVATPQISENANIVAKFSLQRTPLLYGEAIIFLDDVFLKKEMVDFASNVDSKQEYIEINLDKDPKILVNYTEVPSKQSTNLKGDKKIITHQYLLTISNLHPKAQKVKVNLALPKSINSELSVMVNLQDPQMILDNKTNIATYILTLIPNKTVTKNVLYKINLPQDKEFERVQ